MKGPKKESFKTIKREKKAKYHMVISRITVREMSLLYIIAPYLEVQGSVFSLLTVQNLILETYI